MNRREYTPTMRLEIFRGWWTAETARSRPKALFVFGDNDVKRGRGGQAVLRDRPNSAGIPTKRAPSMRSTAFYSDNDYELNCARIRAAVTSIIDRFDDYEVLVLPADGLGTGLAKLATRAPRTNDYLLGQVERLKAACVSTSAVSGQKRKETVPESSRKTPKHE